MENERLERFIKLLKEIFELDKSDLDFGIYRIMNLRKTQIEDFLKTRLPQMVQETLAPFARGSREEIRAEMVQIEENAASMGLSIEDLADTIPSKQRYLELQKLLAEGADISSLETDVYSALYSFFNRYYEEGDFISKRRYKEGVYAIPYEGEEVKLHWANQDQYYIKTSENFKDYTFVFEGINVHFRLVDATTEQNNNKESDDKKRTFMLFVENESTHPGIKTFEYNEVEREIVIRFVYDIPEDKKRKYAEENYKAIQEWVMSLRNADVFRLLTPIPTGKGRETTTILEKHLKGYVAKNTFDYFIHKDLRAFLSRELDFFIKSEIMHLDDLDTNNEARVETYLAKIKAIKRVGKIIIDFLAQIENFQKKLWLKKKFVVETNWCITLDKIDESFWADIINNQSQIDEWIAMYAIDEADGWSNPPSFDFLRQNKNLIVDTKHFADTFKYNLIESIPNLDEQTNGTLIQSENFQALGLLQQRYSKQIKCIYIDPPYNAKSSEILYKNTYKHSSWLSLMNDRLELSSCLLRPDFTYFVAIDEIEQEILGQTISSVFPNNKKACLSIVHNPRGQQGKNISYTHEFAYIIYPSDAEKCLSDVKRAEVDSRNLRDSGTESDRTDAATCFYPFWVKNGEIVGIGTVPSDDFHPESNNVYHDDGTIEIWPIDDSGNEKKWRYSVTNVHSIISKLEVKQGRSALQIIFNQDMGTMRSLWVDPKYDASEYGTKVLQNLLGREYVSKHAPKLYPKSINTEIECISIGCNGDENAIVADFFAGSGTTGHAIISLNRLGGQRKFILVEMGEYFNTVTKPRIKKVVYAPESDWSDGKPLNRSDGVSHIIKYMRLESYEDALSNINLYGNDGQMATLLGEEYLIHYMVEFESRGSLLDIEAFSNPFAYTMKITEKNECKERSVDVCETFNYLIGLTVNSQSAITYFLSKPALQPKYEGAVDLVEDVTGQYAFRQIVGTLPDGRRALVIWRTVTDDVIESNAALDAYFTTYRNNAQDRDYDVIYVNGDNNLENLRGSSEDWKVLVTEIEFKNRMFEEV